MINVYAVTSGAEGWEAIEQFGKAKLQWLRQFAPFANGVPSHDCIANVISRLSVKGFQGCSANWTEAIRQATGGEVIAVDGKTARGSRDRKRGHAALHMVSACADSNRLVLGQEATAEKSNEITAIPKLLELLELTGCLVTIMPWVVSVRLYGADHRPGWRVCVGTQWTRIMDAWKRSATGSLKSCEPSPIRSRGEGYAASAWSSTVA